MENSWSQDLSIMHHDLNPPVLQIATLSHTINTTRQGLTSRAALSCLQHITSHAATPLAVDFIEQNCHDAQPPRSCRVPLARGQQARITNRTTFQRGFGRNARRSTAGRLGRFSSRGRRRRLRRRSLRRLGCGRAGRSRSGGRSGIFGKRSELSSAAVRGLRGSGIGRSTFGTAAHSGRRGGGGGVGSSGGK